MSKRRPSRLAGAILGALLGFILGAMAKSAVIGWDQASGGWALLSALLGMVSVPMFLFLDIMTVLGKGPQHALTVLPWAGVGAVIGLIAGLDTSNDQ